MNTLQTCQRYIQYLFLTCLLSITVTAASSYLEQKVDDDSDIYSSDNTSEEDKPTYNLPVQNVPMAPSSTDDVVSKELQELKHINNIINIIMTYDQHNNIKSLEDALQKVDLAQTYEGQPLFMYILTNEATFLLKKQRIHSPKVYAAIFQKLSKRQVTTRIPIQGLFPESKGTLLHKIIYEGGSKFTPEHIDTFCNHGLDVNAKDSDDYSSFCYFSDWNKAQHNNPKLYKTFFDHGAKPNPYGSSGMNAFYHLFHNMHHSCTVRYEIIHMFLLNDADPNFVGINDIPKKHLTPFQLACTQKIGKNIFRLFMMFGVDIYTKVAGDTYTLNGKLDHVKNKTPLQIYNEANSDEILDHNGLHHWFNCLVYGYSRPFIDDTSMGKNIDFTTIGWIIVLYMCHWRR